jgi:hypothetical protein
LAARRQIVELGVVVAFDAALQAADPPEAAVQADHIFGSGSLVESVHVLGDQYEMLRTLFKGDEGVVSRIGQRFRAGAPPLFVPLPDELRIARETRRRGQVLEAMGLPEAAITSKGRDAAFGGHARAGEHHDTAGSPDRGSRKVNTRRH